MAVGRKMATKRIVLVMCGKGATKSFYLMALTKQFVAFVGFAFPVLFQCWNLVCKNNRITLQDAKCQNAHLTNFHHVFRIQNAIFSLQGSQPNNKNGGNLALELFQNVSYKELTFLDRFRYFKRQLSRGNTVMKPWLVAILISGFVLMAVCFPTEHNERHKRSFKQLPAGLLEPILPLVKAIVPEPLLGKITMLLPLPAASDSTMQDSS